MSEETYLKGNIDLLMMFKSNTFDREMALRIIEDIQDLNPPILDLDGYSTTYLFEAQESNNVEVVRFLLEHGADPNLPYDGETLYDHVLWEVFNDSITPHDWEYIKRFFILLIAYGGGGQQKYSQKPHILEPIDKDRISEYDFILILCQDRYHLEGHLFNLDGMDIGTV